MPGLAFSEMILVLIAIILFVRPDDLPKFVRTLGNLYGSLQRYFYQARAYTRSTFYEISTLDQPPPEPIDYQEENYCDGSDDDYHYHDEYDHDHDYHEHDEYHHDDHEEGAEASLDAICAADLAASDHGATEDVANSATDASAPQPDDDEKESS
jgi:Sec-independent protein translocase protein TatA